MVRRTIRLPESMVTLVRKLALEGESFSATVSRLIQAGADQIKLEKRVGEYIADPVETPGGWRLIVDESRYREALGD